MSDLHALHGGPDHQANQKLVLQAIAQDCEQQVAGAGVPSPDAVLLTGDIAATGGSWNDREYEAAWELLEPVVLACGSAPLYCVPGNHDVQRTPGGDRAGMRLLDGLRNGRDKVDAALADPEDRQAVMTRQGNYREFQSQHASPTEEHAGGSWSASLPAREGFTIKLAGLNSSLLCQDDQDEGRLEIGSTQIAETVPLALQDQVVLVLTHHPLSWVSDSKSARSWIVPRADIHLHGHTHDPELTQTLTRSDDQLLTLVAGALHEEQAPVQRHGYSFNALILLPDGEVVLRHWPRRFDQNAGGFTVDPVGGNGSGMLSRPLARQKRDRLELPPASDVSGLSDVLTHRLGARRTAFPTDASLRELHKRGLVVNTRLAATGGGDSVQTSELPERLLEGRHTLLLGQPGSGKTVVVHETALSLKENGNVVLPLSLADLALRDDTDVTSVLAALCELVGLPDTRLDGPVTWAVDGVDEALASGDSPAVVSRVLAVLAATGTVLATCRRLDYNRQLAAALPDGLFDDMYSTTDWTLDQFADFVSRVGNLPDNADPDVLIAQVRDSPAMTDMVRRPLYARMLVLVLAQSRRLGHPATVADLYEEYLGKLAQATELALNRIGCGDVAPVLPHWRAIAWRVFSKGLRADSFPFAEALAALPTETTDECGYRISSGLLDSHADRAVTTASFVHYSFQEFLLAEHLQVSLAQALITAPEQAFLLLTRDLTPEVRRFLVSLLRAHGRDLTHWPELLAEAYKQQLAGTSAQAQTARNLIAYLACRLGVDAVPAMQLLLQEESDPFLRNSLYWSLTRLGDETAFAAYLEELSEGTELASLNRGYLLYYYGDLPPGDPPFPDTGGPWHRTQLELSRKMAGPAESSLVRARQAVDLYTWCDLARHRGEFFSQDDASTARDTLARLRADGLTGTALDMMVAVVSAVTPA